MKSAFYVVCDFTRQVIAQMGERGSINIPLDDMYSYCLGEVKTDRVRKLVVTLHAGGERPYDGERDRILVVPVLFDVEVYLSLDTDSDRNLFLLDLLHDTLLSVAKQRSWETQPFTQAYQRIAESNFELHEGWKKPLWNRNRTQRAQIYWEMNKEIKLFVEILHPESKIYHLSNLPCVAALEDVLGKLSWQDNHTLRIDFRNQRDAWIIDVGRKHVEFIYPRALKEDGHGMYDLGMMYLKGHIVLPDQHKAIYWLKKAADKHFGRAIAQLKRLERTSFETRTE